MSQRTEIEDVRNSVSLLCAVFIVFNHAGCAIGYQKSRPEVCFFRFVCPSCGRSIYNAEGFTNEVMFVPVNCCNLTQRDRALFAGIGE